MRAALAVFAVMLGVLLIFVGRAGRWAELWEASRRTSLGLIPLLVLATLIAASVEVLVPPAAVRSLLGEASGLRGVMLAWAGGVLTPGGGPVGLPLVATLSKQGAALPVVLTYAVSMSTLSLIRLPLEWGLLGGRLAALRYLTTLLVPPLIGAATLLFQRWR